MGIQTITVYATNDSAGVSPQAGFAKVEINKAADYAEIQTSNGTFRINVRDIYSLRECLNALDSVL